MMLELFAQVGKKVVVNQPPPDPAAGAAAGGFMLVLMGVLTIGYVLWLISLIIGGVFAILVLVAQSKALTLCSRRNRLMEPGQVWLNFIPGFAIVWYIMTVLRVSESLQKEFKSRGLKHQGNFAKTVGVWSYVSQFLSCIPFFFPIMIFIYWRKLSAVNAQLEKAASKSRRSRDDDDDDDEEEEEEEERPRPKKRRPRDDDDE